MEKSNASRGKRVCARAGMIGLEREREKDTRRQRGGYLSVQKKKNARETEYTTKMHLKSCFE